MKIKGPIRSTGVLQVCFAALTELSVSLLVRRCIIPYLKVFVFL